MQFWVYGTVWCRGQYVGAALNFWTGTRSLCHFSSIGGMLCKHVDPFGS